VCVPCCPNESWSIRVREANIPCSWTIGQSTCSKLHVVPTSVPSVGARLPTPVLPTRSRTFIGQPFFFFFFFFLFLVYFSNYGVGPWGSKSRCCNSSATKLENGPSALESASSTQKTLPTRDCQVIDNRGPSIGVHAAVFIRTIAQRARTQEETRKRNTQRENSKAKRARS